jgi:streptomycin 6-kinase
VRIPSALAEEWQHEPDWLAALPRLVDACRKQWNLELEEPVDTPYSLVVPAGDAVLKLHAPSDFEAEHEADALARWSGRGAVHVLARDDSRRAFLCERCRPGRRLWDTDGDELAVFSELLLRLALAVTAPHPFRHAADEGARWAEEVPRRYAAGGRPFERSLLDLAVDVFRSADPCASFLVNQDLHGANVLEAQREPWLVIDPKPLVGEREIDGVGLLRNAAARGHSVATWLDALADLGLDRERLRGWGVAHALAWGWDERRGWDEEKIAIARTIAAAT